MHVQKLSWAGVMLSEGSTTILIDPLGGTSEVLEKITGKPQKPLGSFDQLPDVDAILVTHLHPDHYDPASILNRFGKEVPIYAPKQSVKTIQKSGFTHVTGVEIGDQHQVGAWTVTAVESMDGFATPQVAWVVDDQQMKVLHAGDTIWHGYWWKLARVYGPIDVACLPVNGPILTLPSQFVSTSEPACLTPEQAVEAARILGVKKLVPIHYGEFNSPPLYAETQHVLVRLEKAALERQIAIAYTGL